MNNILLLLGGMLVGLYASVAGGGSFVSFPLLIFLGLPPQIAIATNKLGAIFLESSSTLFYSRHVSIPFRRARIYLILCALGGILGGILLVTVSANSFNYVAAILLVFAFVVVTFKKYLKRFEESFNSHPRYLHVVHFLLGIYGGFFGAGYGTIVMVLYMMTHFGVTESSALGRASGFLASFFALLIFIYKGLVVWKIGLILALGEIIGSWFGVKLAIHLGEKYIRFLLGTVVFLTLIKLLFW